MDSHFSVTTLQHIVVVYTANDPFPSSRTHWFDSEVEAADFLDKKDRELSQTKTAHSVQQKIRYGLEMYKVELTERRDRTK